MTIMADALHHHGDRIAAARTVALIEAAERVSRQLEEQNLRLAEAIEAFHRDVLAPLREGKTPDALHGP